MADYRAIVDYINVLKLLAGSNDHMLQYLINMLSQHCVEEAGKNPRIKLVA